MFETKNKKLCERHHGSACQTCSYGLKGNKGRKKEKVNKTKYHKKLCKSLTQISFRSVQRSKQINFSISCIHL